MARLPEEVRNASLTATIELLLLTRFLEYNDSIIAFGNDLVIAHPSWHYNIILEAEVSAVLAGCFEHTKQRLNSTEYATLQIDLLL